MAGFVKVANEVFRLFRRPVKLGVACRLYELADLHRWAPFACSDSYLMESGAGKRDVRAVLAALESMGLLVIVSPGNRHQARRIRLLDPAEKADHMSDHQPDHQPNHGNGAKTDTIEESGPHVGPHVGPPTGLKYQTHTKQTPDSDSKNTKAENTKAAQLLADWTTAAEFWRDEVNPALGRQKRIPTAKSKVGRRLRSEIKANGLEAVLDSFRWLAHGQKWHARQQRLNDTTTLMTPLRHVEEWAELWQRNGSAEDGPSAGRAPTKSLFDRMFNPEEAKS